MGKPIAGVEIRIAQDGEVLVRGENVTTGYFQAGGASKPAFQEGWFHTGDIGNLDAEGRLQIRGRKKEMIVTPEGLNVFPEDVERVLNQLPGVRESAIIGTDRVHAVLVLEADTDPLTILREANHRLENHQQVRGVSVWPGPELPRTEGTGKLKRVAISQWAAGAAAPATAQVTTGGILSRYTPDTPLVELGLSSLERIELMMAVEQQGEGSIDEAAFATAKTIGDLQKLAREPRPVAQPFQFPTWNRSWWARGLRRINLPTWILPLARVFSWVGVEGAENLKGLRRSVLFASNHQSYFDGPAILMALPSRWRYRTAIAARKEFFDAHFHPQHHAAGEWFTNTLNYILSSLFFNIFPLPQREAGARYTLEYAGNLASNGWSILIFPEGRMTDTGDIGAFESGVGMMAVRLGMPVVPVRITGLDKVLHRSARFPTPGKVTVKFGTPITFQGTDYAAIARQVELAVRSL